MTVRQKVFHYKLQHALPLTVVLCEIIPLYFFSKAVVLSVVIILTVSLFCLNHKKLHIHHFPVFLFWGVLASFVIAFRYVPEEVLLPKSLSKATALEGVLTSDARRTSRGSYIYELKLEKVYMQNISQTMSCSVTVFASAEKGFWGDMVRFDKAKLGKDGKSFSARKIVQLGSRNRFFFIRRAAVKAFTEKIQLVYGQKSFLAEALLTGSRDNLDPMLKEQFRRAGVSHVLALSGMHLGIIALFVFFIVRRFSGPRLSILAVNVVNVLYLLMAGISPSLLRAVIMFALVSLGKLIGNKASLMRILVFTFSLSLMIFPGYFFSLSFQLSFLALAGILLFTAPISDFLERFMPDLIATGLACSLAAVIMTAPVTFYNFGVVYPAGIIASMVISPVVTLYMCLGLGCVLVPTQLLVSLGLLQQPLFTLFYRLIELIVRWASFIPGIRVAMP
ncbi:MAG: ComEC/Rec2 family competence protein [Spirochaetia bacterium]|nr:ComEC/Rec2 family competence protein [Spirochaetia bacterium]